MASLAQVKQFIACWLQLGKRVLHTNGTLQFNPSSILNSQGYTPEFESWWKMFSQDAKHWYLEGGDRTLEPLLSHQWEIVDCSRCAMPVPMKTAGVNESACPCADLELWPNLDLPQPHTPEHTDSKLNRLRQKLRQFEGESDTFFSCQGIE